MSAVLQFSSGASSRHEVMKAANIPAGVFTSEGKDKVRISFKEKKVNALTAVGNSILIDPLGQMECSGNSSGDDDNFPLVRLLHHSTSETSDSSDDISLAQLCKKKKTVEVILTLGHQVRHYFSHQNFEV